MFNTKYLIRLDDACPTMNTELWGRMESLLDKYQVKPMVGVIPHNEDPKLQIEPDNPDFWQVVNNWEKKGWTIAMHGYNHVYSSKDGGVNPMWNKSEFAGHTLECQRDKICKGVAIMRSYGLDPQYFFAPSHTFDNNTLIALKKETNIRIISDTIARKPYKQDDFIFIPLQSGHPIKLPFGGILTICYHPNTMRDESFVSLEKFLKGEKGSFLAFEQLELENLKGKSIFDAILSSLYFIIRKIV